MVQLTRVLLGALVFTLPFDQAFEVPLIGSLSRAVGLIAALVGLLTLLSSKVVWLRRTTLFLWVAGIFVAWNSLTVVWTIDRVSTIGQSFTYIQLWVLIWLLWQFIDSPARAGRLRQAYMLGTWVTVGTILWGYLSNSPTIDPMRFTAFDTNENYTAQSIALALPMAFDAAVYGRGWSRYMAILLIPAGIYGIALTGSRGGGIIAVAALIGGILLIMRGNATTKAIVLAAVTIGITVLAVSLPARTIQRFAGTVTQVESADFSGRGEIWRAGIEAWLFHPAIGAGAGNFNEAVVPTLGYGRPAHNSFLALLVELGAIGPTLFALLFLTAIWPHLRPLTRPDAGGSEVPIRYARLHLVMLVILLLAQLPANWQYQRVTWYILVAATFESALILRSSKPVGLAARSHAS